MSIPLSVQAPAMVLSVGVEDVRGVTRQSRGRSEPQDPPTQFGVACRDILDEVRVRMATQGYQWD